MPIVNVTGPPVQVRVWWFTGSLCPHCHVNLVLSENLWQLSSGGRILLGIRVSLWNAHDHVAVSYWPILAVIRQDLWVKHFLWSVITLLYPQTGAGNHALEQHDISWWYGDGSTGRVWVGAAEIQTGRVDCVRPHMGGISSGKVGWETWVRGRWRFRKFS